MMAAIGKQGKQGARGKTGVTGPRWRDVDISKMDTKLDKLLECIYEGNGSKSLMERTARIEENIETMLSSSAQRDASITSMASSMGELAASVKDHHKQIHLASWLHNKWFYVTVVAAFIISSSLVHSASPWIAIVWKMLTGTVLP
jgi:hypothetical protein